MAQPIPALNSFSLTLHLLIIIISFLIAAVNLILNLPLLLFKQVSRITKTATKKLKNQKVYKLFMKILR